MEQTSLVRNSEFILWADNEHATVYYRKLSSIHGEAVVFTTERGICGFHFLDQPLAYYLHVAEKKFNTLPVYAPVHARASWWQPIHSATETLPLVVRGTSFQRRVWHALCTIPIGTTCSYQTLAVQLGQPQGARAVANAIANNFIAWLIPCHRVVRKNGQMGGYVWGVKKKVALLEHEKKHQSVVATQNFSKLRTHPTGGVAACTFT